MKNSPSTPSKIVLWISVAMLSIVGTLLVAINRHLTQFEATASIYPMQMRCDQAPASVNPCFKAKRILNSSDFRHAVIEKALIDNLTEKTFDRHIQVYETLDHQLSLHSFFSDSVAACSILTIIVEKLTETFDTSNSTLIECNTNYHEALVEDYFRRGEDTTPDQFMSMDMVDCPRIVRRPSASQIFMYFCLSFVFSMMVIWFSVSIWRKLRKPAT